MINTIILVGSFSGWLATLIFLVIYHRSARWWRHGYGRSLFALVGIACLFYTSSALYAFFGGEYSGRTALRLILSVGASLVMWYLLFTLIHGAINARRERIDDEAEASKKNVS